MEFPRGAWERWKQHRESADKRWNVEGYEANLLNRDVEDLFGVNLVVRF